MSAYHKLIGLARGSKEFVNSWNNHAQSNHEMEVKWIAAMRSMGVKLAHPDDGWVKRSESIVSPCYPQFDDQPQVGDLIALGCWYEHRLVRVTKVTVNKFFKEYISYRFEDAYLGVS